jgi:hypothetical protein
VIKKLLKLLLALIVIAAIALTVFWYARPADLAFDQVRASVPNSAYSHFADIDGVRVHYQEKGTGAPLILITVSRRQPIRGRMCSSPWRRTSA